MKERKIIRNNWGFRSQVHGIFDRQDWTNGGPGERQVDNCLGSSLVPFRETIIGRREYDLPACEWVAEQMARFPGARAMVATPDGLWEAVWWPHREYSRGRHLQLVNTAYAVAWLNQTTGVSRRKVQADLKERRLLASRVGNSYFIPLASLSGYVQSLGAQVRGEIPVAEDLTGGQFPGQPDLAQRVIHPRRLGD
jgi:hypothetical protein